MKNYMPIINEAGIGRTPHLCQDALIEMLEELFAGKLYHGQEGMKPLRFFRQDLPIPVDNDEDVDTNIEPMPQIIVRLSGWEVPDSTSTMLLEFQITAGVYDEGYAREGYRDVQNILAEITSRVCEAPRFGGAFTILKPIACALQQDTTTFPYYYGACILTVTAPAANQDSELQEFI